jgi:microcystin-dependent protein
MTIPNVGAITLFAGLYNIKGWSHCDGKTLPTADFTELYEAIGNKYGGDANNFALPNLQEHEKQLTGIKFQIALWENDYAPDPIIGTIF